MTRTTNARLAGFLFLIYIVTGIANMVLFRQATSADGSAATLASIAQRATTVRLTVLLTLLTTVEAVALGVALYALTRDEDRDLAVLALCFRVTEGALAAVSTVRTLGLLSIAAPGRAATAADTAAAQALGDLLLQQGGWTGIVGATCFAIGSTIYCYLFLRARSIPVPLAWLGVLGSVLLVVALPLQLVGFLRANWFMWMPMLVFEVTFGLWLLVKGMAAVPRRIPPTA